jgi:3-hydroxyacyl-CoA dehydrogenase
MKACVIGAGTMGSGIAAHLANLGFDVVLLDMTRESAHACWERAKSVKPAHLFLPEFASRIQLGGIDQDLSLVSECDWVCEAIIENINAKRALYSQVAPLLKPDAMVCSNTSSLPLSSLSEGMPEDFKRRFLGAHFFNPPRYLKLLELIPTTDTDPDEIQKQTRFLEDQVGRRVVLAKDTPGFIANRFGMWAMFHAIHTTEKLGFSAEQVDAVCGPFLGRPRSAAFRLNDVVGLDVMSFIAGIMYDRCPEDPHRETLKHPASMATLLEKGWIGQKAGQGYYRREGKEFLTFDLRTHAYRNQLPASFDSIDAVAKKPLGERIRTVLQSRDEAGEFLREHLIPVLKYAEYLRAEVSHSVEDFDRVMMWGFGWEMGPFAMIDAIGTDALGMADRIYYPTGGQLAHSGEVVPLVSEPDYLTIKDFPLISSQEGFNVRDLGDGVTGIALTTKMGVITPVLVDSLLSWLPDQQGPFVLCGESRAFSVGYDLNFFVAAAEAGDWDGVDAGLKALQDLTVLLSQKKVVAALHGYCLGAGFELACACPMVIAHPDTNMGLPEAKVGLLPGGAGTCRMRLRHQTTLHDLANGIGQMVRGTVSSNAHEARALGFLRASDIVLRHPDRLIVDAIALAKKVELKPAQQWKEMSGPLAGMIDQVLTDGKAKGDFTDHDISIGHHMKVVFTQATSFEEALVKERAEFIELLHHALTVARIKHMLEHGKPLKN